MTSRGEPSRSSPVNSGHHRRDHTPVNSGHHRPSLFTTRRIWQRRRKLFPQLRQSIKRLLRSDGKSHTRRREHRGELLQRRRHRSDKVERLHATFVLLCQPAPPRRSPWPYGQAREIWVPRAPDPSEVRVRPRLAPTSGDIGRVPQRRSHRGGSLFRTRPVDWGRRRLTYTNR
jgi:hypothetical protein